MIAVFSQAGDNMTFSQAVDKIFSYTSFGVSPSLERIGEIMMGAYASKRPSYKSRTDMLIVEANANGGLDNITAVLFCGEN